MSIVSTDPNKYEPFYEEQIDYMNDQIQEFFAEDEKEWFIAKVDYFNRDGKDSLFLFLYEECPPLKNRPYKQLICEFSYGDDDWVNLENLRQSPHGWPIEGVNLYDDQDYKDYFENLKDKLSK